MAAPVTVLAVSKIPEIFRPLGFWRFRFFFPTAVGVFLAFISPYFHKLNPNRRISNLTCTMQTTMTPNRPRHYKSNQTTSSSLLRPKKLPLNENGILPSIAKIHRFHTMYRRICIRKGLPLPRKIPLNIIDNGYKRKWLDIATDYLSLALFRLIKRNLWYKEFLSFTLIEHILLGGEEEALTTDKLPSHVILIILSFIKPVY